MMNFRTIKASIIDILDTASLGRYEVIQAQRQSQGAKDINNLKKVVVYFFNDDFSENAGSGNGTVQSKPTFRIITEVSAKGQYTDSDDPTSLTSAELLADDELDELMEIIFQILMDARNIDLGLAIGQVSNRYIKNMQKSEISKEGDNAVIIGRMDLTCNTPEDVLGETGVTGVGVKSDFQISDDTTQKTAIDVET